MCVALEYPMLSDVKCEDDRVIVHRSFLKCLVQGGYESLSHCYAALMMKKGKVEMMWCPPVCKQASKNIIQIILGLGLRLLVDNSYVKKLKSTKCQDLHDD